MSLSVRRAIRLTPIVSIATLAWATVVAAPAMAQNTGTIRGTVTAANTGRPLEEAQISVVGSLRGARSSSSGAYIIPAVEAGTVQLRVQRLGFAVTTRTVTLAANQTVTVDFALTDAAVSLEAVVVTGTAAQARKKEIGNAMVAISAQDLEVAPVQNTQDILSARATGVTVMANGGQPGTGGTIRLRGNNSVSQGNNPIIYVDGIRIFSENGPVGLSSRQNSLTLNDVKADDIERIEVVKGAAATTLYGTEASGGVIQIFTKKGTSGRPQWSFETTQGYNELSDIGSEDDPTGYFLKECRGPRLVDVTGAKFVDPTCPSSGSWVEKGIVQRYSGAVRGGGEALTYALSGNFSNDKGVISPGGYKDGGYRANFVFNPASSLLLTLSNSYQKNYTRWIPDGNNASGFLLNVGRGPFNNFKGGRGECANITETCVTNGYILELTPVRRGDHFITGLTANWSPNANFTHRLALGYDYNSNDNSDIYPFAYLNVPRGQIWKQDWNHTKLSVDYTGSLVSTLPIGGLASTFSWGGQLFEDREYYTRVDGLDFAGPGDVTLGSAARTSVGGQDRLRVITAGTFLQEMIGWRDRLFITAGLRIDGNSAFGQNFGLQQYPKISAAYVMSDHDWFPKGVVQDFKLRAAVGVSGKAPGAFDAVRTWDPVAGDDGIPGFTPAQRGNPDLGPERTRETEFGFDLGALDGRLGLEVTYFDARTSDALIPVTYAPSEGFTRTQLENVGEIGNKGLELSLNAGLIRNATIEWSGRFNLTRTKSNTYDIGDAPSISTGLATRIRPGRPVPAYYGIKILNADKFEAPQLSTTEEFLGLVYPNKLYSVGTSFSYKRALTLDVLGEYQGGHTLANWIGYQNARRGIFPLCYPIEAKLRAAAAGDASALSDVTALQRGRCAINRANMNDRYYIEDASFFKLRNVSLSWSVPTRWVPGSRSASLTLAGRNLLRITDYLGTDPESADARDAGANIGRRDYYNLPPTRSFLASIRMAF
ncbi:MAG: TonB-dependent receptor [Gemmatimonadaceae bacterium]